MPTPVACPFCGSLKVFAGNIQSSDGPGALFKPTGPVTGFLQRMRLSWGFACGPSADYCAACGMVWSKADAKDAAKYLKKFLTAEQQAHLANLDDTAPPKKATPPSLKLPAK